VDRNRYGPAEAAEAAPNSIQGTVRYQGRAVADLSSGRTLASEHHGPAMDVSANTEMVQLILTFIGRTFGVTAEYLQGNESGGSKLIAGVEASRRQLAVMISSLQQPMSKFLQRVFAAFYAPLLRELIAASRPMKDAGDRGPPPSKKRKLTDLKSEAVDHQDKIIIIFNNQPFLDYTNLRQACMDGVITPDEFREMAGRMYHIPLSGQTSSYDIGPRELLIEPILAQIEANKVATQANKAAIKESRAGAPAASEGTKVK